MIKKQAWLWLSGATLGAVIVALAFISACSSKSSNPYNPGGGGGLELNSGNVPNAGVFVHTFMSAGNYPYHCTIHPAMTGNSVTVSASSANDSAFVQITSSTAPGFTPSAVTIKPGGNVRWLNVQGQPHTVTSGS